MTTLSAAHLAMLRDGSGIGEAEIAARGYYTLGTEDFTAARGLGFSERQCQVPALVIPIWNVHGEIALSVLRPDTPRRDADGKVVKYEWPAKHPPVLDIPRTCLAALRDSSEPLWITEGSKKADAIASRGGIAISLNGVWGWRGGLPGGGKAALGDWDQIPLDGREARLAFDSDVVVKPSVGHALSRLRGFLQSRKSVVKMLYLPSAEDGGKQGVDDWFVAGHTIEELDAYLRSELEFAIPDRGKDGRPFIQVTGRYLEQVAEQAWRAVLEQEEKAQRIFVRDRKLVHVAASDAGLLSIAEVTPTEWTGILERAAYPVSFDVRKGELAPAGFSKRIVEDMLAAWQKPSELPRLMGIAEAPFFGRDGQLVAEQGYDAGTRYFLNLPENLRKLSIPEVPTEADVAAAFAVWNDVLADFPFVSDSDRINAIGYGLSPFLRGFIDDIAPACLVTATTRSSGKGLLADVLTIPAIGRVCMRKPMAWRNDEEVEKQFVSLLRDGISHVHFDNLEGKLASAPLAAFLTAKEYTGRILGATGLPSWPQRVTTFISGNNVSLGLDIPRRVVPVRLAPNVAQPELIPAEQFRHPELVRWCVAHRRELVEASLTIIQNWMAKGMPVGRARLGSFEAWSATLSGVFEAAGIEGFLANRDEAVAAADDDTQAWTGLIEEWWETYGARAITAGDIAKLIDESDSDLAPVRPKGKDESDKAYATRVGLALKGKRGRIYLRYRVETRDRSGHPKVTRYCLEPLDAAPPTGPSAAPFEAEVPHKSESNAAPRHVQVTLDEQAEWNLAGARVRGSRDFGGPAGERAAGAAGAASAENGGCDCDNDRHNECPAESWYEGQPGQWHCGQCCEVGRVSHNGKG